MEYAQGPMVSVPVEVATDLLELIGEARQLGNIVADLVNRAERTLERFEGALGHSVCENDLAFGAAAEAAGLGELYQALGTIADTATQI